MRKIPLAFNVLIVLSLCVWTLPTRSETASTEVDSRSALLDSNSYIQLLVPAADTAARMLVGLGNPVFVPDKTVVLQAILRSRPVAVTVLFPTEKQFPQYLPLLLSSPHSFCQIPRIKPDGLDNVIICDPDSLRLLEIMIRIEHTPQYVAATIHNDWTYMQLLNRIQTEPAKVLEEAKSTVTDEHIRDHMTMILAFLLAHETWHLTHGAGAHFESNDANIMSAGSELNEKLMCRNYQAFPREGLSVFGVEHPIPLAEEGTTESPEFRQSLVATRAIWQEEEDADRFGAETLGNFLLLLKQKGQDRNLEFLGSEIIQNFGTIMLQIWYSKLQPFAMNHCSAVVKKDFYLTQCMCQDKNIYDDVIGLFGATHPPIVLRMHTAAFHFASLLNSTLGINLTSSNTDEAEVARSWLSIIDSLSDVPLKMSMTACMGLTKYVAKGGQIIQALPDLAGFYGSNANLNHPGYPKDEMAFIYNNCAASPHPKH